MDKDKRIKKLQKNTKIDDASINGVELRNLLDLCGFAKCRKPLENRDSRSYAGYICTECSVGLKETVVRLREDALREMDELILGVKK